MLISLFGTLILFFNTMNVETSHSLDIHITNIQSAKGKIFIAIYNKSDDYMQEEKAIFKQAYDVTQTGLQSIPIPNMKENSYAIACFHDLNGNGKLDTNMFGIPTEPYGCSNNVRPKFRAPSWDETKFYFTGQIIKINMEKW